MAHQLVGRKERWEGIKRLLRKPRLEAGEQS